MRPIQSDAVSVRKEGIFLESYIYKCRIQSGYQLLYFSQIQVTHRKAVISFFVVELHQLLIL